MFETILNKYAINQLGYYVEDLKKAARDFSSLFGAGPFVHIDPVTPKKHVFRGEECTLTMVCAYAQFKNVQIELIQVLSDGPDVYRELGHYGLHHYSIWVDDPQKALSDFARAGFQPAMIMTSGNGLEVAYADCRDPWGHYVEIHTPIPSFWNMIKQRGDEWDGADPYRKLAF